MSENLKIMAVVCHPADAIDHSGGTLCLHAERGDDVTVVVCTHGVDSHDIRRSEAMRFGGPAQADDHAVALDRKEQEVLDGMAILGVRDVQPHLLITHNPTEEATAVGLGHSEVAVATLRARGLANMSRYPKKSPRRFPAQVFLHTMYGITTQLTHEGMRFGNVIIDITSVVDKKVQAMDCLASQYYPGDLARKCVEITNGRMGLHWSVPYAESFQTLYPHIHTHLPANDYLLDLAAKPASEQNKRMRIMVTDVPVRPNA